MNRNEEVRIKRERVRAWLEREGFDGVLLSSQALFSWYTGGGENRVVLASEGGAAALLLSRDADVILTDNIEAPRVEAEAVGGLDGFAIEVVPWHDEAARTAKIRSFCPGRNRSGHVRLTPQRKFRNPGRSSRIRAWVSGRLGPGHWSFVRNVA